MSEHEQTNNNEWPLWRAAINTIRRRPDYGYGMTIETPQLEHMLGCKRESSEFAFGMIEIRQVIESEDGYYLGSQTITEEETGLRKELWQIPSSAQHEDVAQSFEGRMKRYAKRSVCLRQKTLLNPVANMTDLERIRMQKSCDIANLRALMIAREHRVISYLQKKAPKLLEQRTEHEKTPRDRSEPRGVTPNKQAQPSATL